jgi:hypothetical protein
MDISSIKPIESAPVVITHPASGAPIGLTVNIRHTSDPKVQAVRRKHTDDLLKQGRNKLTAEKADELGLQVLVAAIVSFEWAEEASFNGEQPQATEANVRKLFKAAPWIKDQVNDALGDESAFFRAAG